MGKDQQFIRQGIIKGILPIGVAFKKTITDSKWNVAPERTDFEASESLCNATMYSPLYLESHTPVQLAGLNPCFDASPLLANTAPKYILNAEIMMLY